MHPSVARVQRNWVRGCAASTLPRGRTVRKHKLRDLIACVYTDGLAGPAFFTAVAADNRIRIWDVLSGALEHEYAEPNHLAANYSCFALSRRSASRANAVGFAAVGTERGIVEVWDLRKGSIVQRLGSGMERATRVLAVVFGHDSKTVFSSASDGTIRQWDIKTGDVIATMKQKHGSALSLALSPDGKFLAGGSSSIRVWAVATHSLHAKFTAQSPVGTLCFSSDGLLLLSAAAGERFLSVWKLKDANARKHRRAVHSFAVAQPAVALEFRREEEGEDEYTAAALLADGTLALQTWMPNTADLPHCVISVHSRQTEHVKDAVVGLSTATNPFSPFAKRAVAPTVGAPPSARSASKNPVSLSFARRASGDTLLHFCVLPESLVLVARGNPLKPVFERVPYRKRTGELKDVVLPSLELAGLLSHAPVASKRTAVTVLGPSDAPVQSTPADETALSLGDRLRLRVERKAADGLVLPAPGAGLPDAQSLATVLSQALHSEDASVIDYCLNTRNDTVVQHTVERLSPAHVLALLRVIVDKFNAKPARAQQLLHWLQHLMTVHTSYLMSLPDLKTRLTPLYNTIQTRLSVFKRLLRLQGRLDLVLAHAHKTRGVGGVVEAEALTVVEEDAVEVEVDADEAHEADGGKKRKKRRKSAVEEEAVKAVTGEPAKKKQRRSKKRRDSAEKNEEQQPVEAVEVKTPEKSAKKKRRTKKKAVVPEEHEEEEKPAEKAPKKTPKKRNEEEEKPAEGSEKTPKKTPKKRKEKRKKHNDVQSVKKVPENTPRRSKRAVKPVAFLSPD